MNDKINNDWHRTTIESLCLKITSGGTPSRKKPEFFKKGTIPWIKTGELNGWYIYDSDERITQEAIEQSSAKLFPPNTVLMAMYGQGNTITTVGILGREASTNQACCAMIVNPKCCNPHFLLYSLKAHKEQLLKLAFGASQRNLSVKTISEYKIPIPNLDIQNRIANILSTYDELIENNERRIKLLEETAHNFYREWFVEFGYPKHENVPLVDSELGQIPQDWKVIRFGDIAEQKRETVHPKDIPAETPYVGLAHIPQYSFTLSSWGRADETKSTKVKFAEGDIIFAKIRPYLHKVVVAPMDGVASSDSIIIVPQDEILFGYVAVCASSEDFVAYTNAGTKGTQMPRADWEFMKNYRLVLPPDVLLEQFNNLVSDIVASVQNMIFRNIKLREARDLLLPSLISGELDISLIDVH